MPGQSHEQELNIAEELNRLSLSREQLIDRRNVVALLIDFKRSNGQNEQQYCRETAELQEIDKELKALSQRKIQLQMGQDRIEGTHNILIDTSVSSAVLVGDPPSFSAPQIILDVQELPRHASQTQCPFCHEYITTDVTKTTSSTSYLMCFVFIMFCCVAGCCLFPFCLDTCKDVVHKCPRCRSHIHTCKKL
ncbi:U11/U12 small nuclear ribonucleoprotein 25 kDa protein isoform X1 [Triplophysa dalaica]|uniref:U11/U12 small nuclear ribonucleoprotein 25 kDa protein isoform X1 n=1 Tax=Triplophysa dalaica TaxID=1582913 RepID=UPI0024E0385F|nr:U11/U12 small nuclear ribonucleoprotein 25 kDa protein isoform X1 [Triplophysa dalaica]